MNLVIPDPRLGLAEFAGLHWLLAVVLVVEFFGSGDEVENVGADEEQAEFYLFKVAVVLDCRFVPVSSVCTVGKRKHIPSATPQMESRSLTTRPSGVRTSAVGQIMERGMAFRSM